MSDEVSIKATAVADIAQLTSWTQALIAATSAMNGYAAASAAANASGNGPGMGPSVGGGAATGAPPPPPPPPTPGAGAAAPAHPGAPGTPPGFTMPTSPSWAMHGPGPAQAPWHQPGWGGAAPAAGSGGAFNFPAGLGAAPGNPLYTIDEAREGAAYDRQANAAMARAERERARETRHMAMMGGTMGGMMSGSMLGTAGGMIGGALGGPLGALVGGGVGRLASGGLSAISSGANGITQLGIGNSPTGFLFAGAQKYMELSKVITAVGRQFRESGEDAAFFGGRLGFTIAQTSALMETLGKTTNGGGEKGVLRNRFQQMAGFGLWMGLDPQASMSGLGGIQERANRELNPGDYARLMTTAKGLNMHEGRFGEFISGVGSLMDLQTGAGMRADLGQALTATALPGLVFGDDDPRAKGNVGMGLIQGVHGMLTSKGPMDTFMMRAMGYGSDPNMSYIEMRKRQERGITDSRNVVDMFKMFNARGYDTTDMFQALEGYGLGAERTEAFVNALGNPGGISRYEDLAKRSGFDKDSMAVLETMMSPEEIAQLKAGDNVSLGKKGVGAGAWQDTAIERMMMEVGKPLAEAIPSLREAVESVSKGIINLSGVDWGTLIPRLAKALETVAVKFEEGTERGGAIKRGRDAAVETVSDPTGTGEAIVPSVPNLIAVGVLAGYRALDEATRPIPITTVREAGGAGGP